MFSHLSTKLNIYERWENSEPWMQKDVGMFYELLPGEGCSTNNPSYSWYILKHYIFVKLSKDRCKIFEKYDIIHE